ncbi:MAG TPA: tetratricopeptide repeat protein [Chthoniobacteraceae bacterium]|nr:tetratricopeptide repeat protein [Chthoniobacteraceae bacterium]
MSRTRLFTLVISLLLLGGAVWGLSRFFRARPAFESEELTTPKLVLEKLPPLKSLYFTPSAVVALRDAWASLELPGAGPQDDYAAFARCTHDPGAWRRLDRERRFDTVWLMGDPAEYRPLLDHLHESPDWQLAYLDATSFLFRRGSEPLWKPADLDALKQRFADHSKREQAVMRVHVAQRLAAIHAMNEARTLLDEALALDPASAPALTQLACHEALLGRWEAALDASTRALEADPGYPPAMAAHAEALFAFGKFAQALSVTRKLVKLAPRDGPTLYLHAKVTHAAKAHAEEIEVLKTIIEINTGRHLPVSTWQVFLGQAYAATGEAGSALEAFESALQSGRLSDAEREFAEKGVERLRGRRALR